MGKRDPRFDPRKGAKIVRSLPRFPPLSVLRVFMLALFAVLLTAFAIYRQRTLPKPVLFRAKATASAMGSTEDDGLIYIDVPNEGTTAPSGRPTAP